MIQCTVTKETSNNKVFVQFNLCFIHQSESRLDLFLKKTSIFSKLMTTNQVRKDYYQEKYDLQFDQLSFLFSVW